MQDLKERCFQFSLQCIKWLKAGKWDQFSTVIVRQVMRSSMSVGANVTEAFHSSTRTEFRRYYEIALKSCNETIYWLRLLQEGFELTQEATTLIDEANEISRMLAASVIKLRKPQPQPDSSHQITK